LDSSRPTQRAHTYSLLRSILSTAVTDEILASNPCRVRGAGSAKRVRSIEPATLGELEVLLESIPAPYRSLVLIGAWCGLRFGEVSELRRKDVDLKAKTIHVKRGVVRVGKEVTVGKPKNIAGVRDIAVPPHLLPILEQHLKEHVALGREALLFPSVKDPDVQVHTNTLRPHWLKARLAAGRPDLRVHDLRHTGAVPAAQSGATLAELMARIGHSTPQMALRYQHVARGRDAEIAARMSKEAKKWSKRREGRDR
jgi:integrase